VFADVILFMCLFLGPLPAEKQQTNENQYVKVNVTLSDSTLAPGGRGRIHLAFSPIDGIHINIDPAVEVSLKNNRVAKLQGDPEMGINKESGFLSTSHPVEQEFSVLPFANPGTYRLSGTIVYYFCSDTEGWCRKFRQPITLKLHVARKR
jgi:hypothetical protein